MINVLETDTEEIEKAIRDSRLNICVVGLGWMGLPTACLLSEAGAKIIGVDTDQKKVELINLGKSPIDEPGLETLLSRLVSEKRFFATTKIEDATPICEVFLIVVPTLIDERKRPDYSSVEHVCKNLGFRLRKDCLIIFESTVGPGVTETYVKNILESASGLKAGEDFGLAYSPIRATGGRVLNDIRNYPRVVAAIDKKSLSATLAILNTIVQSELIVVKDIKTAEATKLFENVYRDVNIALANELAIFCERAGIDFDESKNAANTQPYCNLHKPGVGVGGHCIPVNPYFLIEEAEALKARLRLMQTARKVNDNMPSHTVRLVRKALRSCNKTFKRSTIAVLGISYRANVKEARFSPSLEVISMLNKKGARTRVYDPYFNYKEVRSMGYNGEDSLQKTIEGVDCIVINVGHTEFLGLDLDNFVRLVKKPISIVDTSRILDPSKVKRAGFNYFGVGYGTPSNDINT
jgi:nucleotide sugar dehydrogenase